MDWIVGPERIAPLDPAQYTPAQAAAADAIVSGPRGSLQGPFPVLLRKPELLESLQKVGSHLRFQGQMPDSVRELVILQIAAHWLQPVEWAIHEPIARQCGLPGEVIDAIAQGKRPERMPREEAAAFDFCDEVMRTRTVSDVAFARAAEAFGEEGVVELSCLCGYYSLLAIVMNVAQTKPPVA